jgi:hypothetical protein
MKNHHVHMVIERKSREKKNKTIIRLCLFAYCRLGRAHGYFIESIKYLNSQSFDLVILLLMTFVFVVHLVRIVHSLHFRVIVMFVHSSYENVMLLEHLLYFLGSLHEWQMSDMSYNWLRSNGFVVVVFDRF